MTFPQNKIGLKDSYGFIWMNTGNWNGATFSFTSSFQELTGLSQSFTLASPSVDFSMGTDGRLKYDGLNNKLFTCDAAFYVNAINGGRQCALELRKNGSAITGSAIYATAGTKVFTSRFPISLSKDDYVSVFIKANASFSEAITQASLSLEYMGGA